MASNVLGVIDAPQVDLWYRGGRRVRATSLPVVSWSWERLLDGTAEAEVTVADPCAVLFDDADDPVEDWAHELGISHEGIPDAWIGPVHQVQTDPTGAEAAVIRGVSLSGWYDRRAILTDVNAAGAALDGGDLLRLIHAAAMAGDPSPNFGVSTDLMGFTGVRSYLGSEGPMAGAAVRELADTLLDWTDYGRTVLVRPVQRIATAVLTAADFITPPRVVSDGAIRATQVLYRGASGTTLQVATASAEHLARYGLLTRRFADGKIADDASLLQAAQSRLALLQDAVYIDTGGSLGLAPGAPITLDELVPGIVLRLDLDGASCGAAYQGDFRLTRVRVSGDAGSEPIVEVDLAPLGDVDAAAGEDEGL